MGALAAGDGPCSLSVLQVSPSLEGGGAEAFALRLHRAYQDRGCLSVLLLGRGVGLPQEDVLPIPDRWHSALWARWIWGFRNITVRVSGGRGAARLLPFFETVAFPRLTWDLYRGYEDFSHPGSRKILTLVPRHPDVLHLHNLHARWLRREGFFDLQTLVPLSARIPTILAPQDPWLLTGHCGHPLGCPRWRVGCDYCPDLAIYPAIRRDGTAYNLRRKRSIYQRARLHLATPSKWLMEMFEEAGIEFVDRRVIHNGVDVNLFHPGDQRAGRAALGIGINSKVVLVVGNHLRSNPWKGLDWVRETAIRLSNEHLSSLVDFVCVGDEGEPEQWDNVRLTFVGKIGRAEEMARLYQGADILLHPSRADTFPFVVLEGMSSALPVVATAVGGIPEQVEDHSSGFLVRAGDTESMLARVRALVVDDALRREMGGRGREIVLERFRLDLQVDAYLHWYQEILGRRGAERRI